MLVALVAAACAPPQAGTTPTPPSAATPSAAATALVVSLTPSATPIPLPSFAEVSAPSASVVWVLVAGTRLFRSSDHGDLWGERPLPPQPRNAQIAFIDDHEGWVAMPGSPATQCQAESLRLWHTADAGATWQRLAAAGVDPAQCTDQLAFVDARHGFLEAFDLNRAPTLFRTADGGASWTAGRPLPDPPGFASPPGGSTLRAGRVRAFGALLLLEAFGQGAGGGHHYAFRSADGGASWSYLATAPDPVSGIAFVTATRWLQVSLPSWETSDGGLSWHAYATDYRQAAPIAPEVTFADAAVGYATVRGLLQRTLDGGAHWSAIRTPGT